MHRYAAPFSPLLTSLLLTSLLLTSIPTALASQGPGVAFDEGGTSLSPPFIGSPDMALAMEVITTLEHFSSSSMGFRSAGSTSSHAAAAFLEETFRSLGLTAVTQEPIPLDAWEFHDGYLEVRGLERIPAVSFGGSSATGGPVAAELVYVGNGFRADYENVDATGRIVLANWQGGEFWIDALGMEAGLHGAIALVVAPMESLFGQSDGALQSHDGQYRPSWIPVLSISALDAAAILEASGGAPLPATAFTDIDVTKAEDGGQGYNVIGYLPSDRFGQDDDELILLSAHHDAWFSGAADDAAGVAAVVTLADLFHRAYEAKGRRPVRTLVFTTHDAEEYGMQNAYYDWCVGAYLQVTDVHPEWVGKAAAHLNFEMMGAPETPLVVNLPVELSRFLDDTLTPVRRKLPFGTVVVPGVSTWAEHFTFTAAGIPSVFLGSVSPSWFSEVYHSQYDTSSGLDVDYLTALFSYFAQLTQELAERPLVPYNLEEAALSLVNRMAFETPSGVSSLIPIYEAFSIDPQVNLERAMDAADGLLARTKTLSTLLKLIPSTSAHEVNLELMRLEARLRQTLQAIGGFPYEAPGADMRHLLEAIQTLASPVISVEQLEVGVAELEQVGLMSLINEASYETYLDIYARQYGEEVATWGLQSHRYPPLELWEALTALKALAQSDEIDVVHLADVQRTLWNKGLLEGMPALETAFQEQWMGLEEVNAGLDTLLESLSRLEKGRVGRLQSLSDGSASYRGSEQARPY